MHPLRPLLAATALVAGASAQAAFGIDADQDLLYSIDLVTGTVTSVGSTANGGLTSPVDLCWRDDTDELWTLDADGGELGTIDRLTGAFTAVANAGAGSWSALAWDAARRWFWLMQGDALYRYDPVGSTAFVGAAGTGRTTGAMEVDARGDLLGIVGSVLVAIDPSGAQTVVTPTSVAGLEALAIDADGTVYYVESAGDTYGILDVPSGVAIPIGSTTGSARMTGLAVTGTAFQRGGRGCPDGDGFLWSMMATGSSAPGGTMQLSASAGILGTFGLLLISLDNDDIGGVPLPIDATPLGAPGCMLEVGDDITFVITTSVPVGLTVPNAPQFPGVTLFSQAVLVDLGTTPNALGLVSTDFVRIVLTQ